MSIQKIRQIREFNSPHNNGYLILGAMFIGMFYSFWGRFTALFTENAIDSPVFYFSFWTVVIAAPYLIYGLILLRLSFKKYYSVYFNMRSVNSRKFGIVTIIFFLIIEIVLSQVRRIYIESGIWDLELNYEGINYTVLLSSIYIGYLFLRYGVFKNSASLSSLSTDGIGSRINRVQQRAHETYNTAHRSERNGRDAVKDRKRQEKERREQERRDARRRELERQRREEQEERRRRQEKRDAERREEKRRAEIEARRRAKREAERRAASRASSSSRSSSKPASKPASVPTSKPKPVASKMDNSKKLKYFQSLRPKASIVTEEDFKCIFCFQMPNESKDKYRGIVLCPHCKSPAHADEFEGWAKNSPLCSRCDGTITSSFRRNPKIIPVKDYLEATKYWIKKSKS